MNASTMPMSVGETTVGKSRIAGALRELLGVGAQETVVINGSDFRNTGHAGRLIGCPSGYVGCGQSGGSLLQQLGHRAPVVFLSDDE